MTRLFHVPLALAFLSSSAPAQTSAVPVQPSIQLPPALARVLTDYESAWQAKDAAALSRLFAEDGFVLSNSQPMVRGRKAIEKHYTGSGGALSLRSVAYAIEGKVGYIIGAFSRHAGEPDLGKYTLTLKKDDTGRWLIMSDMDNGNNLPPTAH